MTTAAEEGTVKPRVAQTVEAILNAMGVESYDPRVVNQLLELLYRHVSSVLDDARVFSEHAEKQCINADDIKLAIRSRVNFAFTQPPPRDVTVRLAQERNAIPLPPVDSKAGVALPASEFQLTAQNYQVIVDPNRNPAPLLKSPKSPKHVSRPPKSPRSPRVQNSPQKHRSPRAGNQRQLAQTHNAAHTQSASQTARIATPRSKNLSPMHISQQVRNSPMGKTPPQTHRPTQLTPQHPHSAQRSPMKTTPPQLQIPPHFAHSPQRQGISPLQKSLHSQTSPNLSKSPKKSPKRARVNAATTSPKRQKINSVSQMPPPPEIVDLDGPAYAAPSIARSQVLTPNRNMARTLPGSSERPSGAPNTLRGSAEVITISDDPIMPASAPVPSTVSPRSRIGQQKF